MKIKGNREKGITLIALVVTIIILLILAGVALSGLIKENGLIYMAVQSKEEHIKGKYEEAIKMIKKSVDLDKAAGDLTTKKIMDTYEEELRNDDTFKDAQISRETGEEKDSIIVETKEGYVYEITEDETKYLGKKGEGSGNIDTPPADASIIIIEAEPSEPTKEPVEVTITTTRKEFKIQYSYDTTKWDYYTAPIEVTDNGTTIYARLVNKLGVGSGKDGVASIDILNIDREKPEKIELSEVNSTTYSINVKATATDKSKTEKDGCSGIKQLKFSYSDDNGNSWKGEQIKENPEETGTGSVTYENTAEWTGLTQETNYKVKIIATDYADNELETIYEDGIKTSKIPAGGTGDQGSKIEFGYTPEPTKWTRERIVTIKNNAGNEYKIEYSFTGNSDWKEYNGTGINITANGALYARLKDDAGQYGDSATYNESYIDRLDPQSVTFSTEITTNGVRVIASATDAEANGTSGKSNIAKYYFSSNGGTNWYPTNGQDAKTVNDYTFSDLTSGTEHKIRVKVEDKAGNKKESTQTESIIRNIKIGDIVNYTPDTTTTSYELPSNESGYESNQTVTQETYIWKVLSINKDSVDIIGEPIDSMSRIYLRGPTGYNNGVYCLNKICRTLYSNSKLKAEARCINIEDIESKMNETGKSKKDESTSNGKIKSFTSTTMRWYPNLAKYENHTGIDTDTLNSGGIGESDDGTGLINKGITIPLLENNLSDFTASKTEASSKITAKQTAYDITQDESYYIDENFYNLVFGLGIDYWLASRFTNVNSSGFGLVFGMRYVDKKLKIGSCSMLYSYKGQPLGNYLKYLMTLVPLKSNIQYTIAGDGVWNIKG